MEFMVNKNMPLPCGSLSSLEGTLIKLVISNQVNVNVDMDLGVGLEWASPFLPSPSYTKVC